MSIDKYQLENYIIRPTLSAIGLLSEDAVYLLLGTAAQESGLGTYVAQIGSGFNYGLGIYQTELMQCNRIWDTVIKPSVFFRSTISGLLGYDSRPSAQRIVSDLACQTIIARLYYLKIREVLPSWKDVDGMASYWKRYYNTKLGKGTEVQFVKNFNRYVVPGM